MRCTLPIVGAGLTRRTLLKLCIATASMLAMPGSLGPVMASLLAAHRRRPVIWLSFQECTGCTESLTRADAPGLERLLFEFLSLNYHHTLQAAAGEAAEVARVRTMSEYPGEYLLVVDGLLPPTQPKTLPNGARGGGRGPAPRQHPCAPLRSRRHAARGPGRLSRELGERTMIRPLQRLHLFRCLGALLSAGLCLSGGISAAAETAARSRPYTVHDTDGDGYLNREEYRTLLELRRANQRQRHPETAGLAPAFEEIDHDGDGLISEVELGDMLQWGTHRHRQRGPRWFYPAQGR